MNVTTTDRWLPALLCAWLAGCGAEVAGTAATAATLKATEAEQAQAQKAQLEKKLGEALRATDAAASAAGNR